MCDDHRHTRARAFRSPCPGRMISIITTALLALVVAPARAGLPEDPWQAIATLPQELDAVYVFREPADLAASPAGSAILDLLNETQMLGRVATAWHGISAALELPPGDAIATVFGRRAIVMLAPRDADQATQPWAIVTEITAEAERRLTAAFKPVPRDIRHGVQIRAIEFGRYRVATVRDGKQPGAGYTAVIAPDHAAKLLDAALALLTGTEPADRLDADPAFRHARELPDAPIAAFYRTAGTRPDGLTRRAVAFAATPVGQAWSVDIRTAAAGPMPLPDLSLASALPTLRTDPVLAAASCSPAQQDSMPLTDWLPPSETLTALRTLFRGLVPLDLWDAIRDSSSEAVLVIDPPDEDGARYPSITLAARLAPTLSPAERGDALTARVTAAILDRPTELGLRTKQFARRYPSAPRHLRLVRGSSVLADQLLGPAPSLGWITTPPGPAEGESLDSPEPIEPLWVLSATPTSPDATTSDAAPSLLANEFQRSAAVTHGLRSQGTLDPAGLMATLLPPVLAELAPIRALARIERITWQIHADRDTPDPAIRGTLNILTRPASE